MVSKLILLATLVGCGRLPSESHTKETEPPKKLRIVAMGGRNSCQKLPPYSPKSMSMYAEIERSIGQLSPEFDSVELLLACYRADGQLFYIDSKDDTIRSGVPDDLVAAIDHTPATTLFVGHSYGGWLAMQTLLKSRVKAALYTIDAISPVNCAFRKPQRWLGCMKAPTDVPYQDVAQKTFYWGNFFQTSTMYLHSSEIPHASRNQHLSGVSHTTIDNSQDIWADFVRAPARMQLHSQEVESR